MLIETQFMQRQLQTFLNDSDVKVPTAAIVKSLEAQIEFVKAGVGMALMPSGIERFVKGKRSHSTHSCLTCHADKWVPCGGRIECCHAQRKN